MRSTRWARHVPMPDRPAPGPDPDRGAREGDVLEFARELDAARARIARLERQLRRARAETDELREKLEDVYASETFRTGKALLAGPRRILQWWRRQVRARRAAEPRKPARPLTVDVPDHLIATFELTEDRGTRIEYERLVARSSWNGSGRRIAFAVYTDDLTAGRGDLYAACGLARYLEPLGYQVLLLPPERWYEPPEGIEIYVSLVAERRRMLDPTRLRDHVELVGWVRNNVDRWVASDTLALYDTLWASSDRAAERLRDAYRGPVEVLGLAVDHRLFSSPEDTRRRGVVSTVNQWGDGSPRQLYRDLAEIDVDFPLAIHGVQRGLSEGLQPFALGEVSYFALPSLYERAAVVLDDRQDVNRRYGNVNSRVFEALTCGALPVSNAERGLEALGLGALPVVDGPDELDAAVHRFLEHPDERDALVEALRAIVLERHTYEVRARELDRLLRGSDRGGAEPPASALLGFLPDYRVTNPYQDMLYSAVPRGTTAVAPVTHPDQLLQAASARGVEPVLHIHWTATILGPATRPGDARARLETFVRGLDGLKGAGGSIVWTIHNAMPHECRFPEIERELRQAIAERADRVHVMCEETPAIVEREYRLRPETVHVLPHGSYVDVYPNLVSPEDARGELGLRPDEVVLLFLGQIRPYKGLERLLDAFEELRRERRDVRLLVVGDPSRVDGVDELVRRCRTMSGVVSRLEAVPDHGLQVPLNAADIVVLPHRRVLNSGVIQLAFSFGRPVVAPAVGCLRGQIDDQVGVTFDPERGDLHGALLSALPLAGDEAVRRAAFERARTYTYLDMSRGFTELLDAIVGRP